MSYSTQTDLESTDISAKVLVQLADDDEDGIADAAIVAAAIAKADTEIDGYLGARYPIPVTPVPELIKQLSVTIAIWRLYGHRGRTDERRARDYDDAVRSLKALATGTMVLPAVGGGEVATDGADLPQSTRTGEDRTFTIGRKSTGESGSLDGY